MNPPKQVLMKTSGDCGRAALAGALGISYDEASKYLPGQESRTKADLRDSMIHHKVALYHMRVASRIVTYEDIIAEKCAIGRTCILVHSPTAPTLGQHWVNFGGRDTFGNIILWWNSPKEPVRTVPVEIFYSYYHDGSFNHAHECGAGSIRKPSWWERLWFWATVKI